VAHDGVNPLGVDHTQFDQQSFHGLGAYRLPWFFFCSV
jgi:hypothetical protein